MTGHEEKLRAAQEDLLRQARRQSLGAPIDQLFERHPAGSRLLPRKFKRRVLVWRSALTRALFSRGLDTDAPLGQYEQEHYAPDNAHYQPSGWLWLRRALRKSGGVEPGEVFVDYGSGKGRVVLQAARDFDFARVVGVEIAGSLTEVARANVQRDHRRLRCQDVELVTADAADWPVPDDMTVAYFYYPFTGATFDRVLGAIVESLDRAPRRVRLIYACPGLPEPIERTGRFRLLNTHRVGLSRHVTRRVAVYESTC